MPRRGRIYQINPGFPEREFAGALVVVYETQDETIVGQLYSLAFNDLAGVMIRIHRDHVADTGGDIPWIPPEWLTGGDAAPGASHSGESSEPCPTGPEGA